MARKFARWAAGHIGESFKARINATDPEVKAELHDEIIGARLNITSHENVVLFEDIYAKIESVDIAKAKIFAAALKRDDE
jgi:ribonuclease R